MKSMIADTLSLIVQNIGTIICGLSIAFTADWRLSLLVLALVPLLGSQGYFQMKMMKGFSNDAKVRISVSIVDSLHVLLWLPAFTFQNPCLVHACCGIVCHVTHFL